MAAFILDNGTLWSDPEALVLRPKKRTRKWATKKRTGCLTCRQRHLKCDEEKPSCRRCVIASRECVGIGYSAPAPGAVTYTYDDANSGSLMPWRQTGLAHQPGVTVSPAGVKTSEQERMQFHFLCQVAAASMAGVFDQTFCSRDMLQATSLHPIVWHASCALAAMYQREALSAATRGGGADQVVGKRQSLRNFALEQYNESITGVVAVLKSAELSSLDLEVLLTTTLLFTAVASLQGDMPAAVMHVINGQHILHRWKKKLDAAQMTNTGNKQYISSGLLTPNSVEAVMGRMVSQSSNIRRRPWSEEYYKALETPVISEEPFNSPEDAYYEFEPLSKAYFELGEDNKFILDPAQKQPPPPVRSAYAAALAEWTVKFDAMRKLPGIMDRPRAKEAIVVLQARQIAMEIEVRRDPTGPETSWDAFNPDFARIVALGDSLCDEAGRRVFSFSSSMMDVLVLAATRCRERDVRRRARELLGRQNAREGLCNSRLGYAIAASWAELEEAPKRWDTEAEERCECEEDGFICNDHRVAAMAGDFRVDDVGSMTYWTKRALDRGLPGEVREIAW